MVETNKLFADDETSRLNFTLIGITYGPRPEHWKLWWAFEYEIFAGDFWRMVEQPCIEDPELKVPGSWVEEPMDSVLVEWERSREWKNEELPLLIWSEYRKIRPPM
ncbi:Ankyrin repeat-containing protein [Colletotrichum asianum]